MILGRSEAAAGQSGKKNLWNIHYFNSFFWTKLTKEGYEKGRLAKWTKKIDIFSKDAILLPVNHNNAHWTAAAINFRNKRFESYDSMGMAAESVFKVSTLYCRWMPLSIVNHSCQTLRSYVNLEHHNKKKKAFDFDGWTNWAPEVSIFVNGRFARNSDQISSTDYTTARKRIRLRSVYMPVHGSTITGRGILQLFAEGYALPASSDDMGNRESKALRWPLISRQPPLLSFSPILDHSLRSIHSPSYFICVINAVF